MGSKVSMLMGSLGSQLEEHASRSKRFVDLFAGSGVVARHVARSMNLPVVAVDLMRFSRVLTAATIERTRALDGGHLFESWTRRAQSYLDQQKDLMVLAEKFSAPTRTSDVLLARQLCEVSLPGAFIWAHYGGYYFSPSQALVMSAYYAALPKGLPDRTIALAALLQTASRASASPGHTAQPFRPTERLLPHIRAAWRVDVRSDLAGRLAMIGPSVAISRGKSVVGDSVEFSREQLADGDLVFCDPPYSEAQYSRFYHVLEGIAVGGWPEVFGAGRAPERAERPSSDFSRKAAAVQATGDLIDALARRHATVLWTYPAGERSNGLTVRHIREKAEQYFDVSETLIPMRHSTLGGSSVNSASRQGRRDLHEVLFLFSPR